MAQSFARIYVHLVFSTRYRLPLIDDDVRLPLHEFIRGALHTRGDYPEAINSVEDHIHILMQLGRTSAISKTVEDIKTSSSKWIKTYGPQYENFHWQKGYSVFAVCKDRLPVVRRYIANQRAHHAARTFEDEYRTMLTQHNIAFDERYIWE
jgi:putative transposase